MSKQRKKSAEQTAHTSQHRTVTRVMVWVIALAMIVTTVAAALVGILTANAEEAFPDITPNTTLSKAASKLKEVGVLDGFEDGTFRADETVTRGQMAKIVACFKNIGDFVDKNAVTGFPDVDDTDHWSRGYVKASKDLGIIVGFPDGKFYPDQKVTYEQAIKMLVCALGYTNLSYPDGFISFAMAHNILTNSVHVGGYSDPASRGAIAVIFYNALDVELSDKAPTTGGGGGGGAVVHTGKNTTGSIKDDKSEKIKGIVSATYTTSLSKANTDLKERQITITKTDGTNETYVVNKTYSNLDAYLGFHVEATIVDDDNGDPYIKTLSKTSKNQTLSIAATDFNKFEKVENGRDLLSYWDGNGKQAQAKLNAQGVTMLYNGKWAQYKDEYFEDFESGSITLISNDGDSYYDVAKLTSYKTGVVSYVAKSNGVVGKITFDYGVAPLIVPDQELTGASFTVTKNGVSADLKNVAIDDVVSYAVSADEMAIDFKIVNNKHLKKAVLSSFSNGTMRFTGNSTKYELTTAFANYIATSDKFELTTGALYNVFCDFNGRIAGMKEVEDSYTISYGYLLRATSQKDGSSTTKTGYMMVFDIGTLDTTTYNGSSQGKTKQLTIAQTVKVDGVQYKKDPDGVVELLEKAADEVNRDKAKGRNMQSSQLIRFKLNASGQVTEIDTILDSDGKVSVKSDTNNQVILKDVCRDGGEGETRFVYQGSGKFVRAADNATIRMNSYTRVLFVPENRTGSSDEYQCRIYNSSNFQTGFSYYLESYNVSSTGYAGVVLQYYSAASEDFNFNSDTGIVASLEETRDNDDDLIIKIRYYDMVNGGYKTVSTETSEQYYIALEFNVGDIFRFTKNNAGKMAKIKRVMDIDHLPIDRVNSTADATEQRVLISTDTMDDVMIDKEGAKFRMTYNSLYSYHSSSSSKVMGISRVLVSDINYQDYIAENVESYVVPGGTKVISFDRKVRDTLGEGTVTGFFPEGNDNKLDEKLPHFYEDMLDAQVPEITDQAVVVTKENVVKCVYFIRDTQQDKVTQSYKDYTILTLRSDTTDLEIGETAQLTTTVSRGGTDETVVVPRYTVEPEDAATVQDGVLTAVKGGDIVVTATYMLDGVEYTAKKTLHINKQLIHLTASAESESLIEEGITQITVTAYYNDGTDAVVTATSSSTQPNGVISYSGGKVTALRAGMALLKLSYGGMEADIFFTVISKVVDHIEIVSDDTELVVGQYGMYHVEAYYNDETHQTVIPGLRNLSDEDVIYLEGNEFIYANQVGTSVLTVTYTTGGQKFTDDLTFTVIPRVMTGLEIEASKTEDLYTEDTIALNTYACFNDGTSELVTPTYTFTPDGAVVATDEESIYQLLSAGTVTITASYETFTDSVELEVTQKALEGIELILSDDALIEGQKTTFTVWANYNNGDVEDVTNEATVQSDDESVTVSGTEAGAVKAGSANLIATYGGKTAEATLNVLANSLISLAVTPETVNLKVGESCELSVIGTYSDGTQKDNAADAVYVPEDPDTELITVSANGVITAQAEGSISLVVRYKGITKEVAITITQAAE